MLNQRLQQKLLQKLSPQQILLMKLLQIPTVALEQRIKQEIEENPALEDFADGNNNDEQEYTDNDHDSNDDNEDYDSSDDEFSLDDYLDEDDLPSYKLSANNTSQDDEHKDIPFVSGLSFHDFLLSQIGMYKFDELQETIAKTIIGNIDDSGYLQRDPANIVDDLAFSQNITTNKQEVMDTLRIIQEFDPPGVGARNLQECLLIQLNKIVDFEDSNIIRIAYLLLDRYFNEFTKKHYDRIMSKAKINEDELKEAINLILTLNPKPGNSLGDTSRTNYYVQPDFIVNNEDGELRLSLNSKNVPELRLSRTYTNMLEAWSETKDKKNSSQKNAIMFIKQKIDSAKWFIDAIKQRQNTLMITMQAILEYQYDYFLEGDETKLRPMILKDIADIVKLDISTISRVANSKYVQTPFGTFLLKSFFSESMQTDSGEEVSTREIKKILQDFVDGENKSKPLTDEALTKLLKEKGYPIARRTVAKYREQLNIPVARLRKEL